ncbi:MAG: hypothetical protein QOK20_1540 [Acidimicrobiaceae bacterium]|nr:hypothetical protein [Acidimicrobiaceae bacterium]
MTDARVRQAGCAVAADTMPAGAGDLWVGIDSVAIPVTDLRVAAAWFAQALGFETGPAREPDHEATVALRHPSGACVVLYPAPDRAAAMAGFPVLSLDVASRTSLDDLGAHLSRRGVLHTQVHQADGASVVRMWGPDMIQVRIYWRP